MSNQSIPTPAPVKPLYEDEINLGELTKMVGVKNTSYVRKLVTSGKVPSAKKNELGFWKFSKSAIEAWLETRATRASGPRTTADGRKLCKVRLNQEEIEALESTGHEVLPGYNYDPKKAKEYRRKKALAASIRAEAEELPDEE
jgi:predicted DNA-binding transcriptional regulator AlpA